MAPILAIAALGLVVVGLLTFAFVATDGGDPINDDFDHGGAA